MGKTQACACFIKAWRDAGFTPASSILVGVSNLNELRSLIASAALDPSDFAVVTSDRAMNGLGAGTEAHDSVPVLFTTQQMLRSRTKGRTFSDAFEFHHGGKPRVLRLWDEEILPSDGIVIRLDNLRAFPSFLRSHFGSFVDKVEAFGTAIASSSAGTVVPIPTELALEVAEARSMASLISDAAIRETFWQLQLLVGSDMLVDCEDNARELIGTSPTLPSDFVPVVVMDASGRVRETYRLWEKHRGDLVRLPAASNQYDRLFVRYWQRGVGKDALARFDTVRDEIASAIIEAVGTAPNEDWLVISYQDSLPLLRRAVSAGLPSDTAARIHWLHWGRHLGTNDFKDVGNVIIVGQRTYPPRAYKALGLAASGLPLAAIDKIDDSELRRGEHFHHLLQALCRASVRKSSNGVAGECLAFVISSMGDLEESLRTLFPGLSVVQWKDGTLPTGKVAEAIAHLEAHFADPSVSSIRKKDLREAIGIRSSPNLGRDVLDRDAFKHFLASRSLEVDARAIRRVESAFAPLENGYVHDAANG